MAAERSLARVFHFHRGENRLFHFFGAGGGKGLFSGSHENAQKRHLLGRGGGSSSLLSWAKPRGGFQSARGKSQLAEKVEAKKDTSDLSLSHTHTHM